MRLIRMPSFLTLILLLATSSSALALNMVLTAREDAGYTRRAEPVSAGVILPRGAVSDLSTLAITATGGKTLPAQFETTSTWPDGSVKWLLVDFEADCAAKGKAAYRLTDRGAKDAPATALTVNQDDEGVTISTGPMRCRLDRQGFDLFSEVYLDHDGNGTFEDGEKISRAERYNSVRLTDMQGREYSSRWGQIESFEIEADGPVRATVAVKGKVADQDSDSDLDYTARIHFYAGSGLVRVFFTLANHNPAQNVHDEGTTANREMGQTAHWLLGQPSSVFFEDFSLTTALGFDGPIEMSVGDGPDDILDRVPLTDEGGIYQESSGGDNWYGRVHMNHKLEIPMRFRGAKTFVGEVEPYQVDRPDAWLHVADRKFGLAVAVRWFWQNFPKALTATPDGEVRVGLFPHEWPDDHELQGGEIKTHEVAFYFHTGRQGSGVSENRVATVMGAFHYPLIVRGPAESYLSSGFFNRAAPYDARSFPTYERLMNGGIASKERNIEVNRDRRDEYGWRNFGDTPAYNEFDETGGPHSGRQAISHFNHEYDHGFAMVLHGLRSTDVKPEFGIKWWRVAEQAMWHESEIDQYHCTTDTVARGVLNGGKFAHTSHGVNAVTAGHRGSPRISWWGALNWPWGRGQSPESEHFNNRGQAAVYYLTGNRNLLENIMEQAELVCYKINTDRFAQLKNPERGEGHNLQVVTDAYLLTWDEKYAAVAETILEKTAPELQWYITEEGRAANPDKPAGRLGTHSICVNAVARWTAVMEEKTGKPYTKGRQFIVKYADFAARFLAGGPKVGFWGTWKPNGETAGNTGPWTYRVVDMMMYGHKYADDPAVRSRCLKAARNAVTYMRNKYASRNYSDSKWHTIVAGGGGEYTYFKKYGRHTK